MRRNDADDDTGSSRLDRSLPALILVTMAAAFMALTVLVGPVDMTKPGWLDSEGGGGGPQDPAVTLTWGPSAPMATPGDGGSSLDLPIAEILLVVTLTVAAVIAYVLFRKVRWSRRPKASRVAGGSVEVDETADDLRKAAEDAGNVLRRDVPAQDAIVHAWLTLERAAAESGAPRKPAQTPSEFTAGLLRHYRADGEAVRTLLNLYERARFSTRPDMSGNDVATAQHALGEIMRSLQTAVSEEPA